MAHLITKTGIFLLTLLLTALTSCYYDNEEELYPGGQLPCDTANVSYNLDVAPILATHCDGCHSGSAPSANIRTTPYADLTAIVNNGQLKGVINHDNGFSPMPKNAGKLPNCELAKINAWISKGAPQN